MQLTKCKYFNDHQSACSLMIDDLVPAAVSLDGKLGPYNDWGYLMDGSDSLYRFFKRMLLDKYPIMKGTFFLPLASKPTSPEGSKYMVYSKDIDSDFINFTERFSETFELAFHGIRHTLMENGRRIFEYENPTEKDLKRFKRIIHFYSSKGIRFSGGKFPGYRCNERAIDFVWKENFKWLALSADMINKKHAENALGYVKNTKMVNVPTNVSGDIFKRNKSKTGFIKKALKTVLFPGRRLNPEKYMEYLYSNGYPFTIQEHFQNQRTDGKRQTPNIFDDIQSLDRMFSVMQSYDIWYAKCSEIAHYYDSYVNTGIIEQSSNLYEIRYQGIWEKPLLSLKSDSPIIKELKSKKTIYGVARKGKYVFNNINEGVYRLAHVAQD